MISFIYMDTHTLGDVLYLVAIAIGKYTSISNVIGENKGYTEVLTTTTGFIGVIRQDIAANNPVSNLSRTLLNYHVTNAISTMKLLDSMMDKK